ncbi:MAG: TRAP transporter large permease subunit, partial [Desulfobacterales bacterium]
LIFGEAIKTRRVTALAIGMLTPPLGICLFISCNIAQIQLSEIIRFILPFLLVMVGVLLFMTYVPEVVMFIPNMVGD